MRTDPRDYELVSPGNLEAVKSLLAQEPGRWTPIAGGTDLMVLYGAGKLSAKKLVSIWNLPELRQIEISAEVVRIGAACTYSDLRANETIAREFSLLANAASWTGGIANQNRGTLGGNIVNASPAADSLPALLAYEADLILSSVRGERIVPYAEFHLGYKKHLLGADELIQAICLRRKYAGYITYCRKAGARNAQAISKVCVAALAKVIRGVIEDVRIGMGSVAPVPLRLGETESALLNQRIEIAFIEKAKQTVARQIRPIDDIRSTSQYRAAVAENLVAEFVAKLCSETSRA
ncbi:MAG TPA: FAD binding domain-containing protein [Candidatus Dormibacteraeota bacterium]|jgi:CO/xanthine dehydrogenase FAD-binding subunit|nr:FAD binding domain-containing protein [Candidatus Dormibacteraeota bacterium]